MVKPKVIIVGKLPPPYIGPAVATNIILNSSLNKHFELFHLNTTVNKKIEEFGKGKLDKFSKNLKIYITLIKLLKEHKPDLILIPISQTTLGFIKDSVFILLVSFFQTKILLQLRGSNFKNWIKSANVFTRSFVRFCFKKAEGIIVLGNNLKHLFEDYFSLENIHVVPNGCDLKIPKSSQSGKSIKLLYFSNLLKSKGIKEVIEAVSMLTEQNSTVIQLNAVGAWYDAEFKKECFDFVENNKTPVIFHEPLAGARKWNMLADADIFIFPPNKPEGHPWAIVEALAAGLPIISTDQGAIVESVLDNENGFIVEHGKPEKIAEKLKVLVNDHSLRDKMGKKSKEFYNDRFTEEQMVNNLKKSFDKTLGIIT